MSDEKPTFRERPLEFVLRLFADVRAGEAPTALLLTANVFLLLTAYYFLKVAREPLILLGGGAEVKSYAAVGQSILFVFVASIYSFLASRFGRMTLIAIITLFFVANLVVFWALGERGVPLGVPFFLWVGIFNMTAVAQFWSYAADLYSDEQGKRLFPIIGIGSSIGAVAGAWLADKLFVLGPYRLMLVAAALLLATLALYWVTNQRENREAKDKSAKKHDAPIGGANGFRLVLKDNYLLLFAVLIFALNWVTKTGDYVFDSKILDAAHALGLSKADETIWVGQFKARYFEWSNGIGVILQLFFVSRIVKYMGLRVALILMPLASIIGYSSAFAIPLLSVLFAARAVESSLDYSLSNTTRQALWLITSRDAKYKAKQVIDTFIVRSGDAASAGLVWIGSHEKFSLSTFIAINVGLSGIWLGSAIFLGRAYKKKSEAHDTPPAEAAPAT